jgi:glutamyl-tRNA synthetase
MLWFFIFLTWAQENHWVTFGLTRLGGKDFKATSAALEELNNHLTLRTFLVGYTETIADVTVYGALSANGQAISAIKRNHLPNLVRWFKYIGAIDRIGRVVEDFKAELTSKKKTKSKESNFEIGLLDTDKGVVTRFPPEPSGYLHIGHAKAAMLNQYFAEHYKGKLIIRFDDTNPSKEKQEFQDSILKDLELLGIKGDVITYTSSSFDRLYDQAMKLIKLGKAYCDDTVQEQVGISCPRACVVADFPRCARREWTVLLVRTGTEASRRICASLGRWPRPRKRYYIFLLIYTNPAY